MVRTKGYIRKRDKHLAEVEVRSQCPPILHVSKEARTIGLDKYELCFSHSLDRPVYFNLTSDILFFTSDRAMLPFFWSSHRSKNEDEVRQIRYIAIGGSTMMNVGNIGWSWLTRCYNLQDVLFKDILQVSENYRTEFGNLWRQTSDDTPVPELKFLPSKEFYAIVKPRPAA